MDLIQSSPIRSGSTLIWNIIKELTNKNIPKYHHLPKKNNNNIKIITTIRHPYNSIISSILRYGEEINNENILKNIKEYKKNGGNDFSTLKKDENILLLKYEDFYNNVPFAVKEISKFCNIRVSDDTIENITKKLSIDNVKKISSKLSIFDNIEKKTRIHGKHISKYDGQTNYEKILNTQQLSILKEDIVLNKLIKRFNYE